MSDKKYFETVPEPITYPKRVCKSGHCQCKSQIDHLTESFYNRGAKQQLDKIL